MPECRGNGAGVALVATATSHMAVRGADGCFIDWVGIKGFYELVGYKKWERGYRGAGRWVIYPMQATILRISIGRYSWRHKTTCMM